MEKCAACDKGVYPLEMVKACNKKWHKLCFRCKDCNMVLSLKAFATINDEPYCKPHYMKLFHSKGNYAAFGEGSSAKGGTGYTGLGFSGMQNIPKSSVVLSQSMAPRLKGTRPLSLPDLSKTPYVASASVSASTPASPLMHSTPLGTPLNSPVNSSEQLTVDVSSSTTPAPAAVKEEQPPDVPLSTLAAPQLDLEPTGPMSPNTKFRKSQAESKKKVEVRKKIQAERKAKVSEAAAEVKKVKEKQTVDLVNQSMPVASEWGKGGSKSMIIRPPKCTACTKGVYPLERIQACGKDWHKSCFRCKHCNAVLSLKGFATINDEPYCKPHYLELFKSKGNYAVFSDSESKGGTGYTGVGFVGVNKVSSPSLPRASRASTSVALPDAVTREETPVAANIKETVPVDQRKDGTEEEERKRAEEDRLAVEEARLKAEDEERKKAEEAERLAAEERRKAEEARLKYEAEERRRVEEARLKADADERKRLEDTRLRDEAEERKRADEEQLAAEESRKAEEERLKDEAEKRKKAEEARQEEEERLKSEADKERIRVEAEKKAEEAARLEEEKARKIKEESERKVEEAQKKAREAEAVRKAEEDAKEMLEALRLAKEENEARKRAEEDVARQRILEEGRGHAKIAEEEEEEAARKRREDLARRQAEAEAIRQRLEEDAARQKHEAEKKRAKEEAKRKAAEELAKKKAEDAERRRIADEEAAGKKTANQEATSGKGVAVVDDIEERRKKLEEEARKEAAEAIRRKMEEDMQKKQAAEEQEKKRVEEAWAKQKAALEDAKKKKVEEEELLKKQSDQVVSDCNKGRQLPTPPVQSKSLSTPALLKNESISPAKPAVARVVKEGRKDSPMPSPISPRRSSDVKISAAAATVGVQTERGQVETVSETTTMTTNTAPVAVQVDSAVPADIAENSANPPSPNTKFRNWQEQNKRKLELKKKIRAEKVEQFQAVATENKRHSLAGPLPSNWVSKSQVIRPPACASCGKGVYPLEQIQACGKTWHKLCFRCKDCNMVLSLKGFATINDEPYCKPHYMKLFHSKGNYAGFGGDASEVRGGTGFSPLAFSGVNRVLNQK